MPASAAGVAASFNPPIGGAFYVVAPAAAASPQVAAAPPQLTDALRPDPDRVPIKDAVLLRELSDRLYERNFDPEPLDSKNGMKLAIARFPAKSSMPHTGEATRGMLTRWRKTEDRKPGGAVRPSLGGPVGAGPRVPHALARGVGPASARRVQQLERGRQAGLLTQQVHQQRRGAGRRAVQQRHRAQLDRREVEDGADHDRAVDVVVADLVDGAAQGRVAARAGGADADQFAVPESLVGVEVQVLSLIHI